MNFRKKHLQAFKELVNRTPVENCPQVQRGKRELRDLKGHFSYSVRGLNPQVSEIRKGRQETSMAESRPARETKGQARKKCTGSGQEQVPWEEYRDTAQVCKDRARKAKEQL